MLSAARQAASFAHKAQLAPRCRYIAGRRFPNTRFHRSLSTSPARLQTSNQPSASDPNAPKVPENTKDDSHTVENGGKEEKTNDGPVELDDGTHPGQDRFQFKSKDQRHSSSASRRFQRRVRPKESAAAPASPWFLDRNVTLWKNRDPSKSTLGIAGTHSTDNDVTSTISRSSWETNLNQSGEESKYVLDPHIWKEILSTVRGGLELPARRQANTFSALKAHVVLHCPKEGGSYFLNSIVERIATTTGADLVTIDAQDLAELSDEVLGDMSSRSSTSLSHIGYETYQASIKEENESDEDGQEEDEGHGEEDEGDEDIPRRRPPSGFPAMNQNFPKLQILPANTLISKIQQAVKGSSVVSNKGDNRLPFRQFEGHLDIPDGSSTGTELQPLIDSILFSPTFKGQFDTTRDSRYLLNDNHDVGVSQHSNHMNPKITSGVDHRPLLVHVQDVKELDETTYGWQFTRALIESINNLRKDGRPVIMIGTTSSPDHLQDLTKVGVKDVQSEYETSYIRCIVVTPERNSQTDQTFSQDLEQRVRHINIRHLEDVIRRKVSYSALRGNHRESSDLGFNETHDFISGIGESVWTFDRVHRLAQMVIGMNEKKAWAPGDIGRSLDVLAASDEVKFRWVAEEKLQQESSTTEKGSLSNPDASTTTSTHNSEKWLQQLKKQCNRYEKKLLNGVINTANLKTTFSNVHTPPETIEALKSLTSLSLIRPEAFKYGVLATDKLTGLLLYGPPGTGKTMLAKAVAKESGAAMLEISGAEIFEMWVGESEKNIKAVFSLAKKLSPCVIFLDEADALFGSRGRASQRSAHRELVNQFLKEIEGINDSSAFIMVATNRPFDLDDAVLRRLPRRLLVDLPTKSDRESILRIHLQNEVVDDAVSLSAIAEQTPLYSGSDLKNLAVTAAIACVTEENEEAAKHKAAGNTEPYAFAEKRTLYKRHFDKALDEISASISDDMSSLTAIRKFDEKYGDRKGRRKKNAALGFGNAAEVNKRLETGRVRN